MRDAKIRVRIKGTQIYADAFTDPLGTAAGTGYDAAGTGRRAVTWRASAAGPNAALTHALPTLRRRAHDAVRQNAYAESAVNIQEGNIVGTGIKPEFHTKDAGLNRDLDDLFLEWTDESDADGQYDWYGQQALAVRSMVEGGEIFVRRRFRRFGDMATVPLQLQVLEGEYCPAEYAPSVKGREVMNGIEFDLRGRRTAYYMYRRHPNDWSVMQNFMDGTPRAVPAGEILHMRQVRRPGQVRGEPWLTRALIKLRDLDKYDDATLLAKQIAAMFAGFIELPDALDKTSQTGGTGVPDGIMGEGAADENGVAVPSLEPALIQRLYSGEKMKFSEPPSAGADYEPFTRQQNRALAVGTGALYELLTGDYGQVNDRQFRAAVNEFRRRIEMHQHHIVVFQFCRPVVSWWLDAGVLSGEVKLPRSVDLAQVKAKVRYIPQGWPYIHPVQDVNADIKAVRAGFTSRSKVVSKRGENAADIDREQTEDQTRADTAGLKYDSDGRRSASGRAAGGDRTQETEDVDTDNTGDKEKN